MIAICNFISQFRNLQSWFSCFCNSPSTAAAMINTTLSAFLFVSLLIGLPISSYSASERLFSQNVGLLADTRLDPLVNPGTCSSHVHSVYGNANFGATITPEMLLDNIDGDWRNTDGKYNQTTSAFIPNLSMYWAPSLYVLYEGMYHLVPSFARPYYRITLRGDGDASRVNPYPPFLSETLHERLHGNHGKLIGITFDGH